MQYAGVYSRSVIDYGFVARNIKKRVRPTIAGARLLEEGRLLVSARDEDGDAGSRRSIAAAEALFCYRLLIKVESVSESI